MNKNLFVCHSQAQLILAVGLVKGRFIKQNNTLILFKDFSLDNELINNLNNVFDNVSIRAGEYPQKNKKWKNKFFRFINDLAHLKKTLTSPFNKVFIVCDQNLQELYIIKKTFKLNTKTEFIWLEDGSYPYFLNIENKNGLNKNRFTIYLRKIIFKYVFLFGSIYDYEGNYMAGNNHLKSAYLTLPESARNIFQNKKLIKIERNEYLLGINSILSNQDNMSFKLGDIIIVFDKFDTYENLAQIKEVSSDIIKLANFKSKKVLYKLHPREEVTALQFLKGAEELNHNYGFEFYIQHIIEKSPNLKVIGFKSTTLQVAKFFNLETISLFLLSGEVNEDLYEFYKRLNIKLISNKEDLKGLI